MPSSSPMHYRSGAPPILRSHVPTSAAGEGLVAWLAARFTYHDVEAWLEHVVAGRIRIDGRTAGRDEVLRGDDEVAFTPPPLPPRPELVLTILHDDGDLVAVDKPPHLVAHREGAFAHNTFLHELERRCCATEPLHLVHRLDRETSGVLLLARHAEAVRAVQAQFARGEIEKRYLALVRGVVTTDTLTIDAPIGPAPGPVPHRRAVLSATARGARPARTDCRVRERFAAHTLLEVTPQTGRTHQIRVHLAHLGHPIEGDVLYGDSEARYAAFVAHLKAGGDPRWLPERPAGRHLLHAGHLALRHPRTGAPLELEAPAPADFTAAAARTPSSSPGTSSSAPGSSAPCAGSRA